jgi:hypothetical protein
LADVVDTVWALVDGEDLGVFAQEIDEVAAVSAAASRMRMAGEMLPRRIWSKT